MLKVELVGRRGNNNVERKLAVVYAAEALSFFIGARGLAVRRMRNTFPTVALNASSIHKDVVLWRKARARMATKKWRNARDFIREGGFRDDWNLERTTEEYDSLLSAKKVAARTSDDYDGSQARLRYRICCSYSKRL